MITLGYALSSEEHRPNDPVAHAQLTFLCSRNKLVHRIVNSPARALIRDGKLVQENLQREWMRQETLQFELRLVC